MVREQKIDGRLSHSKCVRITWMGSILYLALADFMYHVHHFVHPSPVCNASPSWACDGGKSNNTERLLALCSPLSEKTLVCTRQVLMPIPFSFPLTRWAELINAPQGSPWPALSLPLKPNCHHSLSIRCSSIIQAKLTVVLKVECMA